MEHITQAQAVDAARGVLTPSERASVERHATACADCASMLKDWERFAVFVEADERFEPPADALRVARSYLTADRLAQAPSQRRGVMPVAARLAFDTMLDVASGVRSDVSESRHLLYEAPPLSIDIHLQRGAQDRLMVAGQVADARRSERLSPTARIALMQGQTELTVVRSNAYGEFSCDFAADTDLALQVDADGVSVRIPLDRWPGARYVH